MASILGSECNCDMASRKSNPDFQFVPIENSNYAQGGEIDIIEGVHDNVHNQVTWHTAPGCNLTETGNFTGTPVVRQMHDISASFFFNFIVLRGSCSATRHWLVTRVVGLQTGVEYPTGRHSMPKVVVSMPCFGMRPASQFVS